MDFGKLASAELKDVDFTLPADGRQTLNILSSAPAKDPAFYVGCAKWGRKEWVGMIYPPKTKEANFLDEYVKHFNSIELNAVFYSIPKPELIRKWREKADQSGQTDFLFFPKFSRTISHIKRLKNAGEATDQFLKSIYEFGPYLGPCFLQLGDNFGPNNMDVLQAYLESLPLDLRVFVEVRHPAWFADPDANRQLFAMLSDLKKGAAITDASGRRDCLHMEVTVPQTFVRFVGNGSEHQESDFRRIDDWVQRIKIWMEGGLSEVYFFLHQHDEKDTPILADYTIKQFNLHLNARIPEIRFLGGSDNSGQSNLFT
ncbi:DUF72 domain-containing protein [Pedobacter faecalis]|uniref:DUF72 domain-containing protein n=1 Tax=Pedobacter faecalis TaxID=3041495 RepID=UPI00254C9477|nr:DUF72 domain-containing protein [Pedobacter sp. ELA7]